MADKAQSGPITRSDIDIIDEWVTDYNTYEMKWTKECYISQYFLEQLWVTENKTKLLLLVNVDDDHSLFDDKGSKIEKMQEIE